MTDADFKELVEYYLGTPAHKREITDAAVYARHKLELAIEREGDADGERREPWYLAQLVADTIRADRFSKFCLAKGMQQTKKEREHPAEAKALHRPQYIVS